MHELIEKSDSPCEKPFFFPEAENESHETRGEEKEIKDQQRKFGEISLRILQDRELRKGNIEGGFA